MPQPKFNEASEATAEGTSRLAARHERQLAKLDWFLNHLASKATVIEELIALADNKTTNRGHKDIHLALAAAMGMPVYALGELLRDRDGLQALHQVIAAHNHRRDTAERLRVTIQRTTISGQYRCEAAPQGRTGLEFQLHLFTLFAKLAKRGYQVRTNPSISTSHATFFLIKKG